MYNLLGLSAKEKKTAGEGNMQAVKVSGKELCRPREEQAQRPLGRRGGIMWASR